MDAKSPVSQVAKFYQQAGQRLVKQDCYPIEIHAHLAAEEALLIQLLNNERYTAVIEVGCMHGCLHFSAIARTGIRYLGIDIVPESITVFQELLRTIPSSLNQAEAEVLDVATLSVVSPKFKGYRVLVVFPFNSFGNLEHPTQALAEIAKCDFDVLVLTYGTDEFSNSVRTDYYTRCGYKDIRRIDSKKGVCFLASEGLLTWAYSAGWFAESLCANSFDYEEHALDSIGIAYWGKRLPPYTDSDMTNHKVAEPSDAPKPPNGAFLE